MAVKSGLHRLSRRLPTSSETDLMVSSLERDINAKFESAKDVTLKSTLTSRLSEKKEETSNLDVNSEEDELMQDE